MKREIVNIVLLGSGNVATHLGLHLQNIGYNIIQVYSRTEKNAMILANRLNTDYTSDPEQLNQQADLYLIAAKDDSIATIASFTILKNKFLVHTAGSVRSDIFIPYTDKYGVLYPFQTFTKTRKVNFKVVPVLVEANTPDLENELITLAEKLSEKVLKASSDQRAMLHISAVFACNFTNHMYAIAADLLKNNDLSFDLLQPLIMETAEKVMSIRPADAQTGPAVRFDRNIMDQQMTKLNEVPVYQEIYRIMSESIQNLQNKK
ncbi:Rossmann-like and DUF2520 domain-containing protein [Saccharicrinis sp. FJH2]|uniref:Rossmann-like and DUF2520 domain-containing protein n=1 Tax=Saccharicrinis sp. FJH65 TaxID=3344659 RepID=UPI0035F2278D